MRPIQLVRAGVGAVVARVPDVKDIKSVAERAPSVAIGTALKTAEIGMAGYSVASRSAAQVAGVARQGIGAATSLLRQPAADAPPNAPTTDPYAGGPLRPVDDIREAVFLSQEDAAAVEATPSGEVLSHDDLPLADFDHLTIGELRTQIRRLEVTELVQLREYEQAHANRLPVMKVFDNRIAALAKASGTEQ